MDFRYSCRIIPLLLLTLLSCERVIDSVGPAYERKPVLTGLVQPDSLIGVRLSYSGRFDQQSPYEMITNATVSFYENGRLMGEAEQVRDGLYELRTKPTAGNTYRVVADIPEYGRLDAEDVLPVLPQTTWISSESKPTNPNSNPDFTLTWNVGNSTNYYWLGAYVKEARTTLGPGCPPTVNGILPPGCTFVDILETQSNYIVSNSLYFDRFNASFASFAGAYLFQELVRFNADNLIQQTSIECVFSVANQYPATKSRKKGEGLFYDFMAVGPQYDKYLKTVTQAHQNRVRNAEDALNNPFAEITPVYSNVKNGLGVFGAMSRRRIVY